MAKRKMNIASAIILIEKNALENFSMLICKFERKITQSNPYLKGKKDLFQLILNSPISALISALSAGNKFARNTSIISYRQQNERTSILKFNTFVT
jgi:hypothetical protein